MGAVNNMNFYLLNNLTTYVKGLNVKCNIYDFRYYKEFVDFGLEMFSYGDLPEDNINKTLSSQVIETGLMFYDRLCWYKSSTMGLVFCRYIPNGNFDINFKPTKVNLIAFNGKTIGTEIPYDDIVVMRDNRLDIIPFLSILEYIDKMKQIEDTLFTNLIWLKLPAVFTGDKTSLASFKKLFMKLTNFEPLTVADKQLVDSFQQFDIKLPYDLESMLEIYKNYRNFGIQSFGVSGIESQKRERLLVGEVESQSEYISFTYNSRKKQRQEAIDEVNRKWGYKIKLIEEYEQYRKDDIELIAYQTKQEQVNNPKTKVGDNNDNQ